nr:hypothetical protein [Gemmatimonadaceae bacterium]
LYFGHFDAAAHAAGLEPLRLVRSRPGEREVRLWTQVEIGVPKELYRFVAGPGTVGGELILHWPIGHGGERRGGNLMVDDMMRQSLEGVCDGFARSDDAGICRARFRRDPPWSEVLRAVEAAGLWTIPDPSALPDDSVRMLDGWTIVAEMRDGPRYRTWRYNSPAAHPRWPSAAQVRELAKALDAIGSLVSPSTSKRVYRGVTTGMRGSAFHACDGAGTWEFDGELRALASSAPAARRARFPREVGDSSPSGAARRPGTAA